MVKTLPSLKVPGIENLSNPFKPETRVGPTFELLILPSHIMAGIANIDVGIGLHAKIVVVDVVVPSDTTLVAVVALTIHKVGSACHLEHRALFGLAEEGRMKVVKAEAIFRADQFYQMLLEKLLLT